MPVYLLIYLKVEVLSSIQRQEVIVCNGFVIF